MPKIDKKISSCISKVQKNRGKYGSQLNDDISLYVSSDGSEIYHVDAVIEYKKMVGNSTKSDLRQTIRTELRQSTTNKLIFIKTILSDDITLISARFIKTGVSDAEASNKLKKLSTKIQSMNRDIGIIRKKLAAREELESLTKGEIDDDIPPVSKLSDRFESLIERRDRIENEYNSLNI
jgi:hypothetical protein